MKASHNAALKSSQQIFQKTMKTISLNHFLYIETLITEDDIFEDELMDADNSSIREIYKSSGSIEIQLITPLFNIVKLLALALTNLV